MVNIKRLFPAFTVANYRTYWITQLIALIGFWLQLTAQQWYVYEMTGSAFLLGLLSTAQFTPSFLFTIFTGLFIDRHNKRKILMGTQFFYMVQALCLALLLWSGHASYGWILCFAFIIGLIDAFDMPTRLAFLPELVGKENLHSAVSLNSANFNITRIAGPVLAAFLLGFLDYGMVFFLNALSLLPIIYTYATMRTNPPPISHSKQTGLRDILDGLQYARRTPVIRTNLLGLAIVSTFIINFGTYGPPFAARVLMGDLTSFSSILSAIGIGSLAAGLLSSSGKTFRGKYTFPISGALCGFCLMAVSYMHLFFPAMLLFAAIGFFSILFMIQCNTSVQMSSPPQYLGRIMSLYTFVFLGSAPFGSLLISSSMEYMGTSPALCTMGALEMALFLWLFLSSQKNGFHGHL